jgi:hypothetical protein
VAIEALVDETRVRCLWYLRPDYYPTSDAARLRVLASIERHGDRATARRAAALRQWLSQHSSGASVGS